MRTEYLTTGSGWSVRLHPGMQCTLPTLVIGGDHPNPKFHVSFDSSSARCSSLITDGTSRNIPVNKQIRNSARYEREQAVRSFPKLLDLAFCITWRHSRFLPGFTILLAFFRSYDSAISTSTLRRVPSWWALTCLTGRPGKMPQIRATPPHTLLVSPLLKNRGSVHLRTR